MRVAVPVLLCMTAAIFGAQAQTAPPRRITDVTAVLDQQKPDPSRAGKMKTDADAEPPAGSYGQALADFLYRRAQARAAIGRLNETIADVNRSIEINRLRGGDVSREQFFLVRQYQRAGDSRKALQLLPQMVKEYDRPGQKGKLFGVYRWAVVHNLIVGDVQQAEANLRKVLALADESRGWRNFEQYRSSWAILIEDSKARIFEAQGQFSQAEVAYHRSQELRRDDLSKNPSRRDEIQIGIDYALAYEGRTKARQGRLAEAEADIRRALLSRLSVNGKFNPDTAQILNLLAGVMVEQARYNEAEQLARATVDIYQALGYREDSKTFIDAMLQHASTLNLAQRSTEAEAIYDRVDTATRNWDPGRRLTATGGLGRVSTLINTRNPTGAVDVAKGMFERSKMRFGERHTATATAQGYYGAALARAGGHDLEALKELKAAMPSLISASRENDDDDAVYLVQRDQRNRFVIETYITLLARISRDKPEDVALETFQLADLIRGHAVQRALAASSARMATRDQALAALIRQEQDLQRQIGAQLEVLNDAQEQREEKPVRDLQVSIDRLRTERVAARRNIERRFPAYANLVDPKPPTVDEIRAALGLDEAVVSFYLGRFGSFVWVVPKQGPLAFAAIPVGANAIESKVRELRKALEPEASTIDDIPQFDLKLAYELYNLLLRPVGQAWKPAKHLIVVTNGALGLLPLSLLPTSPFELTANAEPLFANYREVPWLARTHSVTMIPSIAALRTLRQLPMPSAKRENLVGFGDPYFNAAQAAEGQSEKVVQVADSTLRGLPFRRRSSPQTRGFDSAELGLLPRLPDTATELKSIAVALEADPSRVLHLGIEANEQVVKTIDLSKYRIVVFATHGLVPGDLDGLTQPALALTAPSVAHVAGDGLLTMEEILALKLDADWVVLSACNTGAAAGLGAEAVSGLGRAFFYAGTRAVLVTNWSVHSDSARELVSDLFRRQSADPKITRGEALRQAMVAMIDNKGYIDPAANMLFSYAHPLFWAPYSIIGDGGKS
jgi:CHAT domain-containing protein